MFQVVKSVFTFISKAEGNIILSEMNKRFYYNTIILNKALVEVIKTKEGLDTFNGIKVSL